MTILIESGSRSESRCPWLIDLGGKKETGKISGVGFFFFSCGQEGLKLETMEKMEASVTFSAVLWLGWLRSHGNQNPHLITPQYSRYHIGNGLNIAWLVWINYKTLPDVRASTVLLTPWMYSADTLPALVPVPRLYSLLSNKDYLIW